MMPKNEIIQLIEAASRQALAQYNSDLEKFDKSSSKNLLGAAQLNLYNERTIAYHFNKYIELSMVQNKRPYYFVSEARVKYKPPENEVREAESEIKGLNKKSPKKISVKEHDTFIPDALVMVPSSRSRPLYCIEYKVSDEFEYLKLAADFLKYKYYSGAFDRDSAFVYILLFKEGKSLGMKGAQELKKDLHDEEDFKKKSWFYYLGKRGRREDSGADAASISVSPSEQEKGQREGSGADAGGGERTSVSIEKGAQGDSRVTFAAAVMADAVLYCVNMIQFDGEYIEAVRWGVGRLVEMLKIEDPDGFSDIVESTRTQLRFLRAVLEGYA